MEPRGYVPYDVFVGCRGGHEMQKRDSRITKMPSIVIVDGKADAIPLMQLFERNGIWCVRGESHDDLFPLRSELSFHYISDILRFFVQLETMVGMGIGKSGRSFPNKRRSRPTVELKGE